jgi:hypothetical protein
VVDVWEDFHHFSFSIQKVFITFALSNRGGGT